MSKTPVPLPDALYSESELAFMQKTGHGIAVAFSAAPSLILYVTSATLAGFDIGSQIDITSGFSKCAKETAPPELGTPSPGSFTALLNLKDFSKLQSIIGKIQSCTVYLMKTQNRTSTQYVHYESMYITKWTPGALTVDQKGEVTVEWSVTGGISALEEPTDYAPEGLIGTTTTT